MNKIDIQIKKIKKSHRIGLMTHVVVGYPNFNETEKIIEALVSAGSDFVELQIPFSDPIADGPTVMSACEQALKNGFMIEKAFYLMGKMSSKVSIPLLLMGYYNTIFNYGVEKFCQRSQECGASGLIIPDIPPEEELHEKYLHYCLKYDLYPIRVISPASNDKRLQINARIARGFVYCVSRFGVTGTKSSLDLKLNQYLKKVKRYFKIPVAVGFGISKKEHIKALKPFAEIAVIGSAIIDFIKQKRKTSDDYYNELETFIKRLIT